MINLESKQFRDRIMGCWMGKNCGGTLGAPLEKAFAEDEPFNIKWYPKLEPGGMPNDDLEMQLVWLKALEEVGPGLTSRDLAQYWLDHIGYNFDEYGLSKTNLRLGLRPPVSGNYNNWFIHCMGCPIRSEIWACIAPGAPRIAVRYAYEDVVTDHAGGESVWGEFFNTAIESAAFVEHDIHRLFDIGRSYVPDASKTAKAIDAARDAFSQGLNWKEAREAVMKAAPSRIAQYSPINMGFQVIGLLYGKGFGDTLCLTVNCGYDTDCTGATVGSILGILKGYSKLPRKWTEPLGEAIATNASWGGLTHVLDGPNPIPADLQELTDRTVAVARKVMAGVSVSREYLMADTSVSELVRQKPMSLFFKSPEQSVTLDYGKDPVISPIEEKRITAIMHNDHPQQRTVTCRLNAPKGWNVRPQEHTTVIRPYAGKKIVWNIRARENMIHNSNSLTLCIETEGMPSPDSIPVVLIGARALQISGPYKGDSIEAVFPPEQKKGNKRGGRWRTIYGRGNRLPGEALSGPGIMYVRAFLKTEKTVRFTAGVQAECAFKEWVNGKLVAEQNTGQIIRPAQYGNCPRTFKKGMNEILIKFYITGKKRPEAHLFFVKANKFWDGMTEAEWTRTGRVE